MFEDEQMVLVVDDEFFNQLSTKGIIESLNYQVQVASSGKQALQMIDDDHGNFFLIFMDNEMPEMTGVEAIRKIRLLEE